MDEAADNDTIVQMRGVILYLINVELIIHFFTVYQVDNMKKSGQML